MKNAIYLVCTGTFLCSGLYAQYTPPSMRDSSKSFSDSIKTVNVTATRTEKEVMDVGRDVTVISNEQIKAASCNTLAELLSQQAGVFIDGAGQNPGVIQTLFLRGADNNHTTIMVDGVPISDPSNDHNELDLSELPLADIERIEIVRGSHSTLYGSSAMGGVINIITNNNYTPGLHGDIGETGGEFGPKTQLLEENAFLNYTFKNGIYAEGGYYRWDDKGLSSAVDTLTHPLPYQQNPQNNLDKGDVFSKVGFKNAGWNIYFEYRNTNQTFGLPEGAFEPANNYSGQLVRDFYSYFAKYNITSDLHVQYLGSYSPMHRTYTQDTFAYDTYNDKEYQYEFYKSATTTNDAQVTYDLKTSHFIVGGGSTAETMNLTTDFISYTSTASPYYYPGMDQYYTSLSTLDSIKPSQIIYDGFAQADLNGATFSPKLKALSLLLGARYSSNSMFGNNVSYEINPSYKINKNSMMYLSYSTGFNAPSLYELYGPDDIAGDPVSLANAMLKPETSTSFEVGIKHHIGNTYFTLSYFSTVVSNYIDYVYLWNKNKPVDSLQSTDFMGDTYLNVGTETTQGFEFNIMSQLDPKFSVSANMSILSSSLEYSASNIDTTHTHGNSVELFNGGEFLTQSSGNIKITGLLRRPGAMANIAITYKPISALSFTGVVRYVGARTDAQYDGNIGVQYFGADASTTLSDYTIFDVYASYKITKHFTATARCENLFNTTYYEILGYNTLGRSVYLNLSYIF